ncbi:MAG TPA: LysM peptidoglycan-binding domain-containing protein, partial [Thermoanaerobaculia bacterium]|nr:LysM peptidoglycan-binding domain-containing protein [Thermoanaerobaculia bacterium]
VAGAVTNVPVPSPDESLVPADFELEPFEEGAEPAGTGRLADAATLLADSLAALESAHALWEQGLVDAAFTTLDRAYALMAAVEVEGDSLLAQEKEELRRLISRRVVEIYASRRTSAGDLEGSIPLEINEHVQREIASFSGPERRFFLESYARSGQFRPMILEELRAGAMPLELAWMPLVESGFKVRAYSVARALGLWQFIPSTGYRFGLERSHWIDERMDPHKSTKAAIAYLTELHGLFGDWLTALAAYNCGEHLVLRLLSSQPVSYFDHFWDLYLRLPRETRRYVPRFLAVLAITQDPEAYGFDLPEPTPPAEWELLRTERTADLGELERRLGLVDGRIKGLNPELRRNATPPDPYEVRVPKGMLDQVAAAIVELPARVLTASAPAPSGDGTHRVRPGETLSRVAARYGTTVEALVALNGLSRPDRILPGQSLRVRGGARATGSPSSSSAARASSTGGEARTHRVQRGDNLWVIAQRYGTTVERIKRDNGLRGNRLEVGQKLVIRDGRTTTGAG